MITIASTRFNDETWNENTNYRNSNKMNGCIYGSPIPISESIPLNTDVVICEMNNSKNKIMGLGLIKNYLFTNKYYKIYSKGNYNRFTYKGKYRIDHLEFDREETLIIKDLEDIVFKGKGHLKRGFGVTSVPQKKLVRLEYDMKKKIQEMFLSRFKRFD